jgi:hypothetical protein
MNGTEDDAPTTQHTMSNVCVVLIALFGNQAVIMRVSVEAKGENITIP